MGVNALRDNRRYSSAPKLAKRRHAAAVAAVLASTVFIQRKFSADFNKQARNDSILTGQEWLDELLIGHPKRFYASMGMHKHVFRELLRELIKVGLHDTRYVSSEEQLAIFLYLAVTGVAQRHLEERFQRSPDTISKAIHRILNLLTSDAFYNSYVQLPDANTPLASEIRDNPKLFPFFKDCQGSIDGTHIDSFCPDDAVKRYRNRKGGVTQNVLAACSQDMRFTYILSGWEGSAADGYIFEDARRSNLTVPSGKYFLADAGFSTCSVLMVPYRGERYHLKEWGRVNIRPKNYRELFNLRHAQARNVVERIFGVVKRRFQLLVVAPEYDLATQAKMVPAICVLHNFIRIHDVDDIPVVEGTRSRYRGNGAPMGLGGDISNAERNEASELRESIAMAMWDSYKAVIANQNLN